MELAIANDSQQHYEPALMTTNSYQLKILFSSDEPGKLGKTYQFSASDASKNAINISSTDPVVVNSVLDMSIRTNNTDNIYFVTGDVKRCKQNKNTSTYEVSIQLKNRVGTPTDLDEWIQLIKNVK